MRYANLLLVALLGTACSFIDDFGGFTFDDSVDATIHDAGSEPDGGMDAGIPFHADAALDASQLDAAPLDAPLPDAGTADANLSDATPLDAGCRMVCGGECTDTNTDTLHCGDCGTSCAAPDDATATCGDGVCGWVCNPGYYAVVGTCEARLPPRQVGPLSTTTATSRRPTFRWELSTRSDGARIEICADRLCTVPLQTVDASGTSGRPTSDLPTGVVFWRLFGNDGSDIGVDPSPTWQLYIPSFNAPVETSWGTTLDVNGDGYADVLVGAQFTDDGTSVDAGSAYLYHGSAAGLSPTPATTLVSPDGASNSFGVSVASAGDVNGDGYADVIIGAHRNSSFTGLAYVYLGGPDGLDNGSGSPRAPETVLVGRDGSGGNFGFSVAGVGDVNGDGYGDVVVGAYGADSNGGRAYLYLGGPNGLENAAGTPKAPERSLAAPAGSGGHFGYSVAGAGDLNGDGFADFALGANVSDSSAGRVYVYYGSGGDTTLHGPDGSGGNFGVSVASAGDVNGDGFADLIVGADSVAGTGRAYLYLGSPGGLESGGIANAPVSLNGLGGANAGFGGAVRGAGDVNGDGFGDVLVGARSVGDYTGRAYVYLGGSAELEQPPETTLVGPDGTYGLFGTAFSSAGDVNGDGYADVVIGADRVDDGAVANVGFAYFYLGGSYGFENASGVPNAPDTVLVGPGGEEGYFGGSIAGIFSLMFRRTSGIYLGRCAPLMRLHSSG